MWFEHTVQDAGDTHKYKWRIKCRTKLSAHGNDEGPVHLPVGVSEQNIWEAALQQVLAQEWRFFHNLGESAGR